MNKIKNLVLTFMFSSILCNCATVNSGSVVDDGKVEGKLQNIYDSSEYKNANIYVSSYNGEVLLTGQVPNIKTKENAEFDARATPGVNKIYDFLDIRLPQSLAAKTTDSFTTTQVRAKILNLEGVSSNNIKVVTTNNIVYLAGVVTKAQATLIANAAASINGVDKVITIFNYISR
ncbi:MAG: hypothetical protein K0R49_700 [Burkholderiales bacterium]|jgi:osmotically-inducible protein OsmY|nr:hypothetical protein [Burkholderiales bacterium]MCE3268448.1 hypothetical protein [Burkholderiales bacterium]